MLKNIFIIKKPLFAISLENHTAILYGWTAMKNAAYDSTGLRYGLLRTDISGITNSVLSSKLDYTVKQQAGDVPYTIYFWGVVESAPETLIDYSTTGLNALTKDNTGTWSMTASADDTFGTTTSGFGGFELEYDVVPESGTLGLVGLAGVALITVRRRFRD